MAKYFWFGFLAIILVIPLLVTACASNSSTSQSTTPATTSITAVTTTAATSAAPTSTSTQGNWWDKYGQPKYGGTINFSYAGLRGLAFDPYTMPGGDINLFYDSMFGKSWTSDRSQWGFVGMFTPDDYVVGNLVETWEWTDPTTLTVRLHQGVKFQNKAPVNGRELTAADVQSHYDRLMGTGGGYTQPAPMYKSSFSNWVKVTAVDQYTVTFKFKTASAQNFQSVADPANYNNIEAPEWIALGGSNGTTATENNPLKDWKTVVGTGPWMLTDFVAGSVISFEKNPDYWKTDPRYPQNKLPYADSVHINMIPDMASQVAAMRTGKIDMINTNWQQAANLLKTNSDLPNRKIPMGSEGVNLILTKAPFTNIKVRQALQMAIDRKAIAGSIYGGNASNDPSGVITQSYAGYCFAYQDWPQSLKDQYSYNPAAAKQLLAEAGFPDGFSTNVVADTTNNNLSLLQAFKAYFNDVGVKMDINTMDAPTLESMKRGGKADQMSTDYAAFTWPPTRIVGLFYSKSSDAVVYGVNDPAYDALYNDYLAATEASGAAKIMQQIDQYYLEQNWQVMGPEYYNFILWQTYLKGYSGEYFPSWGQQALFSTCWIEK
jgi:peptide/nickel transport system substrate-binding protein